MAFYDNSSGFRIRSLFVVIRQCRHSIDCEEIKGAQDSSRPAFHLGDFLEDTRNTLQLSRKRITVQGEPSLLTHRHKETNIRNLQRPIFFYHLFSLRASFT